MTQTGFSAFWIADLEPAPPVLAVMLGFREFDMEIVNTWIRGTLTGLLLLVVVWWLSIVSVNLADQPVLDNSGSVVLDEFGRAKDILLAVLPMLSISLGYWFGAAGKAAAEERANQRSTQLNEVLDAGGTGLLAVARKNNPDAFHAGPTRKKQAKGPAPTTRS